MRPDAYDMMLMGALGGAILIAVPAFVLGYWTKRWMHRCPTKTQRTYIDFVDPTYRVGGPIAGQRAENELPQSPDRHISIPYPASRQDNDK